MIKKLRRIRKVISLFKTIFPNNRFMNDFYRIIHESINAIASNQTLNLPFIEKKDKLFIFGAGASINNLTKDMWIEAEKSYSFGFNHFITHDFTANIHFFEF